MKTGRWSVEEIAFLRQTYPIKGAAETAKMLDRNFDTVVTKATRLGIKIDRDSEFWKQWRQGAAKRAQAGTRAKTQRILLSESTTRVCTCCNEEVELSEFGKSKTCRGGLNTVCKSCRRKEVNEQNAKNAVENEYRSDKISLMRSEKECLLCKQTKKRYEFGRNRTKRDGYQSICAECQRQRPKKQRTHTRWNRCRWNAKSRGLDFDLSEQEINRITAENRCFYCPRELPKYGVGLDRIDNSLGYVSGNVVPCCTSCNRIRQDEVSHQEMIDEIAPAMCRVLEKRQMTQFHPIDSVTRCHDNGGSANDYEGRQDHENT